MKATIRFRGDRALEQAMEKFVDNAEDEVERIVGETAFDVHRDVIGSVQKGPATGAVYELFDPRRTHQASAPGQPPQTDTGRLASSISVRITGYEAVIFSRTRYAEYLEFGTRDMAARPFFNPAVERNRPRFVRRYNDLIDRSLRGVKT